MFKHSWLNMVSEITLIVLASAALGIVWNRTLLTDAWRGAPTQQVSAASQGEALPMPVGLMQVKEMLDAGQAVVVDARSAGSFAEEHIEGAVSLPLEEALKGTGGAALLKKAPRDAVIIAYCNGFSCRDSMDLGKVLIKEGYSSVFVFEGGLPEWRDAGYPVARGKR